MQKHAQRQVQRGAAKQAGKRQRLTLEQKLEVIRRWRSGDEREQKQTWEFLKKAFRKFL